MDGRPACAVIDIRVCSHGKHRECSVEESCLALSLIGAFIRHAEDIQNNRIAVGQQSVSQPAE